MTLLLLVGAFFDTHIHLQVQIMRMHLAISRDALVQFDESIEFWSNFNLQVSQV